MDKRGFLTISLMMSRMSEGRIYLRRSDDIREGYSGWSQALSRTNISSDAIEAVLEGDQDSEYTNKEMQVETLKKHKGFNRFSLVSDLLMSEVIANYAREALEKNEDSGVESGNSFDNTGSEINSELSSHEDFTEHKVTVQINNKDMDEEFS